MDFAFSNFHEFLQMGKYGLYVWLCYGLTTVVIVFNIVSYKLKRKHLVNSIKNEQLRKLKQQQNISH